MVISVIYPLHDIYSTRYSLVITGLPIAPDNRSGSDNEPDRETAAEKSDRSIREITSAMPEWAKVTGQKQRSTSAKTNQPNKSAKIRDPENWYGKPEK